MTKLAAATDKTASVPPPLAGQTQPSDATASQPAAPAAPALPALDSSRAVCNYTNFCRVIGTPEEVLLDLGLNDNPTTAPPVPVAVTQRVVMNYYTAKRLLAALRLTVERHEAAFGVIEVDVQRRLTHQGRQ
jgi:hypothetical protein